MKCLRCETTDLQVQVRGEGSDVVEIDTCPDCHGVWLDAKELSRLDDNFFVDVEKMEFGPVQASEEDKPVACPRCEGGPIMNKVHPIGHETVVIDNCATCEGFWLDGGELEKMKDVSDKMLISSLLSLDE